MGQLIFDLVGTYEPPWSPPPPTNVDEIKYQSLRLWFIDHEPQFIPLWRDFYESQDWALHPGNAESATDQTRPDRSTGWTRGQLETGDADLILSPLPGDHRP